MRVLAEIGVGGVDGQRCVTLVELVSHTGEWPGGHLNTVGTRHEEG